MFMLPACPPYLNSCQRVMARNDAEANIENPGRADLVDRKTRVF